MPPSSPAVFLDRDGVLIRDISLVTLPSQVEVFPDAASAVARLRAAGYLVVVVSNQTVVARGLATMADVDRVNVHIASQLRATGARVDGFYVCPHHPSATVETYRVDCDCRKPKPGLLLRAARELDVDLSRSTMIGDRPSDIAAGAAAGCRTILVETGQHAAPPIESSGWGATPPKPDHVCADLGAAADVILGDVR